MYNSSDCHPWLGTPGPTGHIIFGTQNSYSGELLGRASFSLGIFSVGLARHLCPFLLSCQASAQGVAASGRGGFKACLEGRPLDIVDGDGE